MCKPSSCELSKMRMCIPCVRHAWNCSIPSISFLLMVLHLPPPLPPPVSKSSRLFNQCQLWYCATLLFKVVYCKGVFFIFVMCYLWEKYYKPIAVQYYIADCVSRAARLTLLDLRMHSRNRTHMFEDLAYSELFFQVDCLSSCHLVGFVGVFLLRCLQCVSLHPNWSNFLFVVFSLQAAGS